MQGIATVVFSVIVLYAAGFSLVRMRYVTLSSSSKDGVVYHSNALMRNPDGMLGKAVDFYKPAFLLEARFHGSETVVINGWAVGMRFWKGWAEAPQFRF